MNEVLLCLLFCCGVDMMPLAELSGLRTLSWVFTSRNSLIQWAILVKCRNKLYLDRYACANAFKTLIKPITSTVSRSGYLRHHFQPLLIINLLITCHQFSCDPWLLKVIKMRVFTSFALNNRKRVTAQEAEAQEFIWILYLIQPRANQWHVGPCEVKILSSSGIWNAYCSPYNQNVLWIRSFCQFTQAVNWPLAGWRLSLFTSHSLSVPKKKKNPKMYEAMMHIFPLSSNRYVAECLWSCDLDWVGN